MQGSFILEGYFDNGRATGFARWIFEDGICFEGKLKNFKCHGQGKKFIGNSMLRNGKEIVQEGNWINNVFQDDGQKTIEQTIERKAIMVKNALNTQARPKRKKLVQSINLK